VSYYCHYCHISITYHHRLPPSALRLALAEELRPGEAEFIGQSADAKVREAPEKNWMSRKIYINLGALIFIYIYIIYDIYIYIIYDIHRYIYDIYIYMIYIYDIYMIYIWYICFSADFLKKSFAILLKHQKIANYLFITWWVGLPTKKTNTYIYIYYIYIMSPKREILVKNPIEKKIAKAKLSLSM
jgi:hypothetical protein